MVLMLLHCDRRLITVKISSARASYFSLQLTAIRYPVAGVTADLTDRVKAGDLMREFAGRVGGKVAVDPIWHKVVALMSRP